MGGGDSKSQDLQAQNNAPQNNQQLKNNKNKKDLKANSPRIDSKAQRYNKSPLLGSQDNNMKPGVDKYVNKNQNIQRNDNLNKNNSELGSSQNQVGTYENIMMSQSLIQQQINTKFDNWDPIFHENGMLNLELCVWNLQSTYQCKTINKQYSQNVASLSWQYEQTKVKDKKMTCLRFILQEDDGYMMNFLVDNSSICLEGDQEIWKIICPFRTLEQVSRVGSYVCQRFYKSNKQNYDEDDQQKVLDAKIFDKWEEKPPMNRLGMKKLIKKKRMIQQLKSLNGFQYSQVNKYYNDSDQWKHTVMIEEKNNCFKSWVVSLAQKSHKNGQDFNLTLKSDIENRQRMFIEQIKKKKGILKAQSIQKR